MLVQIQPKALSPSSPTAEATDLKSVKCGFKSHPGHQIVLFSKSFPCSHLYTCMNKCTLCERSFEYSRKKGGTKTCCNSCYVNKRRHGLKEKCINFLGGKCENCGYSKCKEALDFHHLDPSKKDFNISGSHARSWSKIEGELKKCVLLCANCHREIHTGVALTFPFKHV